MKVVDEKFFKAIRDFLTVYIPKQRRLSPNTAKSYRSAINLFTEYMQQEQNTPLAKITFDHLNRENVTGYLDWMQRTRKCSETTRNQRLIALRSFVSYCSDFDIANVALQVDISKVRFQKAPGKNVEYLNEDAMKTLLNMPILNNYHGLRNGTFMILMYDTAARCQEMLDLKLKDFILDTKKPYAYLTGKGEKSRPIPLMEKTVQHLMRYLEWFHPEATRDMNDYLFYTVIHNQRHQMSPDTVERFVKSYGIAARKANPHVPEHVHPHQFRHTRAIHWYRSGIPLSLVSDYLGHVNLQTTLIYAYADTEMKRKAIEKVDSKNSVSPSPLPIWKNDDDMIRQLYCLKQ